MFGLTPYQDREHCSGRHEPLLSDTLSYLLCGRQTSPLEVDLKKASLCRVELMPCHPRVQVNFMALDPQTAARAGERTTKVDRP